MWDLASTCRQASTGSPWACRASGANDQGWLGPVIISTMWRLGGEGDLRCPVTQYLDVHPLKTGPVLPTGWSRPGSLGAQGNGFLAYLPAPSCGWGSLLVVVVVCV